MEVRDDEIIKALERMSEEDPDGFSSDILGVIQSQKAEIERLRAKVEKRTNEKLELGRFYVQKLKTAKSEARKEFVERLEEEQIFYEDECGDFVGFISVKRIENLLAEMEGQE